MIDPALGRQEGHGVLPIAPVRQIDAGPRRQAGGRTGIQFQYPYPLDEGGIPGHGSPSADARR